MKAKEYFQKAYKAHDKIAALQEQIADLRGSMVVVKRCASQESVQAMQEQDPVGNAVTDALDRIAAHESEIDRLQTIIMDAGGAICQIEHELRRRVMRERYVYGQEWAEIMRIMEISKPYVFKLHADAMDDMDDVFEFAEAG